MYKNWTYSEFRFKKTDQVDLAYSYSREEEHLSA